VIRGKEKSFVGEKRKSPLCVQRSQQNIATSFSPLRVNPCFSRRCVEDILMEERNK
jgi:hypothetical protein